MRLAGYPHLLAAGRRLQWDAAAIDLTADVLPDDAGSVRRLVAGFVVAERSVATHLTPFVAAEANPGARACFTLQQGDERRHAAFFERVAREVALIDPADAADLAGPEIVALFEQDLPARAQALADGGAQLADAVALYHLVLEGIVFAIGQDALLAELDAFGTLPGTRDGVARVQADERWHVGLGVLSLSEARADVDVTQTAARAAAAWGPQIATPERTERVLAAHARRVKLSS